MPETEPIRPAQATYGDLFEDACDAARNAILLPHRRQLGPDEAHAELVGYQQFLRTSGFHLGLLARFHHEQTGEQRHLVNRLTGISSQDCPPSNWLRAAQALGAGHDLLATHLDSSQQPKTPEAEDVVTPSAAHAPARALTELVMDAVSAGEDLAAAAARSQRDLQPRPIPPSQLSELRRWAASLLPFAKAATLDVSRTDRGEADRTLSSLAPAPLMRVGSGSRAFDSQLEALRVLSQLTFGQARGQVPASPTSLRDLALLGVSVTNPDFSWLPEPSTVLARLDRAQARDHVEAAHESWFRAAQDLTQTIVGTTRAPGLYGHAIEHLRSSEQRGLGIRVALFAALPRLGTDAAAAISGLQSQNGLVARAREPGHLSLAWRPISPAHAGELAARFRDAGTSSEVAARTVRRILSAQSSSDRQPNPAPVPSPSTRRDLALSRSAQR
ncbi:hypothetical protein [Nocardioides ungokensis]|uniref:hypothetical protein n=1 Tax=Nocardioides ungokensis TaxID=1643322 RepID=UPI0015DD82D3|nr:hypothetical protein [Nocardioides ungokensis]